MPANTKKKKKKEKKSQLLALITEGVLKRGLVVMEMTLGFLRMVHWAMKTVVSKVCM